MRRRIRLELWRSGLAALGLVAVTGGTAMAVNTTMTMFQNGVGGYDGTFQMRISMTTNRDGTLGSSVANYLIDGYQPDNPETPANEFSPDEQDLLRFDNIIGTGPGQIPSGALILDAKLQMTTSNAGTADSPGPWGVAALLQPFDANTRYANFPGGGPIGFRGAWWEDGYATRPSGGFDRQVQNDVDNANVRSLVQRWADGESNHGFVLQAGWPGQTNGWGFYTTGIGNVAQRPKLSVTYTTDPVAVNTFQRDLNGYSGDTMAWVRSGDIISSSTANPDPSVDDITNDGYTGVPTVSPTSTIDPPPSALTSFQEFLDGPVFGTEPGVAPTSNDDFALLKFGNVFGSGAGQAPADKSVAKAWVVITTGNENGNARSNGNWAAYTMLRDWDSTSLYSNFGDTPGLSAEDGDISGPLDVAQGMVTGSEVWFDVTSHFEGVRNGAADLGLAITQFNTSDGWEIHFNGSAEAALRPRLIVVSDLSAAGVAGDYNNDGKVDAADYVLWRKDPASHGGDPNGYNVWRSNFGSMSGAGGAAIAAAVPEPCTAGLGILLAVVVVLSRRGRGW